MGSVGKGMDSYLSDIQKEQLIIGIKNHTKEQNAKMENTIKTYIEKEKQYVDNLDNYIKIGYIKSADDEWYQGHLNTYKVLKAQYEFVKKERKKQGK